MDVAELIHTVSDNVGLAATAKNVYGEPITCGDRTVIPVAKVKVAFGAGGGSGHRKDQEKEGGGGGGGGRAWAEPCGALEISPQGTRFIYYQDPAKLAIAAGIAAMVAFFLFNRRGSKD